jgi:hypothetical protein
MPILQPISTGKDSNELDEILFLYTHKFLDLSYEVTFTTKILYNSNFILSTLKYNLLKCFRNIIILLIMAKRCICIHTSILGAVTVCTSD